MIFSKLPDLPVQNKVGVGDTYPASSETLTEIIYIKAFYKW